MKPTPTKIKRVAYGIIGPDGELYMSESCICEDANVLREEECRHLNEESDGGYTVVPLYIKLRTTRRTGTLRECK